MAAPRSPWQNPYVERVIGSIRRESLDHVKDDADVRSSLVEILGELDYGVIDAPNGPRALRQLDAHPDIRLLLTDVGLPGGMNGRQLANEALRRKPGLKVLFATGYARNAIIHHGRLDPGVELIMKPFTYGDSGAKVRRILDA
jgi:CheY-like chemotaxis protein